MKYLQKLRRFLILTLIGKTEVCCNMKINGEIEYNGENGGVINKNNIFSAPIAV